MGWSAGVARVRVLRAFGVLAGSVAGAGAGGISGQAPNPDGLRVVMEVDTTVIHLGDPVSVLLLVDHPGDWSVQWADSLDVAPFEVLRYEVAAAGAAGGDGGASSGGDLATSAARLTLTSFELGEQELPPIEIPVVGPDGTVQALFTDPYRIGVESVGLDESGDIREIRGPLTIARNWWALVPWLLLAAAAGAGALYMRRRMQARPVAEIVKPKTPPRPHHLVALEALDELERSSLLERGQVKTWHVRVSEIIRTYVEGQLEVPALEMTTGEVVAGLRKAALGSRITDTFHTFLVRCDLVKFAKLRPGAEASREVLSVARSLVEMTSGPGPVAESAEQPDAPVAAPARAAEPAETAGESAEAAGPPAAEPAAPAETAGGSQ